MDSTSDLRKEYITLRNSGALASMLGSSCSNCGSEENIEYHHIVPIHLGGTNRFSNIVPLCNACHKAAHRGRHISEYTSHAGSGRPTKVTDDVAFKVLDAWSDGQIGNRKCSELMGLSQAKTPRGGGAGGVVTSAQYKRWCKERGYEKVTNNLDVKATTSTYGIDGGVCVGLITKTDGSKVEIYFNDTGLNDDVMYKIRRTEETKPFRLIKTGCV